MLILAIDTCDARGSVAVLEDEKVLSTAVHDSSEDYSTWLLPAVYGALLNAGRKLAEVGVYAAAAGPGSFTGVRVALTTVKAWSEVFGRPIAAVSRLEALAMQTLGPSGAPAPRFVAASCDAQRGQLYAAIYRRGPQSLQRFQDETVVGPAELIRWAAELAGDSGVAWGSLDPGPLAAEPAWQERDRLGEIVEQVSPVLAPAIGKIALRLAAEGKLTDGLSLDANYIHRPDAEVKWKGYARPVVPAPAKVVAQSVRPFRTADADAVAQLAASSPQAAQWPESSYAQLLASGYKAWVSVAPAGERPEPGAITGFLISRAIPPDAEILNLAVAPQDRRRGVGGALLGAALSAFGSVEVRRVFLEVRASNGPAISFYKKHLFRGTGVRPGYYQNPVEDAIQMERML